MVAKIRSTVKKIGLPTLTVPRQVTSLVPYIQWRPRLLGEKVITSANAESASLESVLAKLVETPSVSGDTRNINAALEYIDRFLSERALYVKRYEFNGVESLVATTKNTKHPKVMLLGHIDVVPADDSLFQLRKTSKTYIGRGVLDMKGPVASMLMSVDALKDAIHEYDFGVMITGDEETSGYDGTRQLVEIEGYRADVVVCPDGATNWALQEFAKGVWHMEIRARGKAAHGSRPWEGESAIETLMLVLRDIRGLFDHSTKTNSTINIGTLRAGNAKNQIADLAEAGIDIRFGSHEDVPRIQRGVSAICKQYSAELHGEVFSPPCINDPSNPYLADFLQITADVIGHNPGTTISYALDDARFFNAKGVPCIVFSPEGGGHHGPEEWVPIDALSKTQEIITNYLQKHAQ